MNYTVKINRSYEKPKVPFALLSRQERMSEIRKELGKADDEYILSKAFEAESVFELEPQDNFIEEHIKFLSK